MKIKEALKKAFVDTLRVVFWSGVPATGVYGLVLLLSEDVSIIIRYAPYLVTVFNTGAYFIYRFTAYWRGWDVKDTKVAK